MAGSWGWVVGMPRSVSGISKACIHCLRRERSVRVSGWLRRRLLLGMAGWVIHGLLARSEGLSVAQACRVGHHDITLDAIVIDAQETDHQPPVPHLFNDDNDC